MKWYESDVKKVVPFTGVGSKEQRECTAKVRLLRKTRVPTQAVTNVPIAVPADDGVLGLFLPKKRKEKHLLVAPTLATAYDGKVPVPVLNLVGKKAKLPQREALGTWTPMDEEMHVLELGGELNRERVADWLRNSGDLTNP